MSFDKAMLKIFFNWIKAREDIRIRKELGEPKPWTNDPILQAFSFCNVRRMDDRVSKWLIKQWYPKFDRENLLWAACMARLINWPDTLLVLRDRANNWDAKAILKDLEDYKAAGYKVFTGAYIINGARGGSKVKQVVENVQVIYDQNRKTPLIEATSMRATWANLVSMPGLGSFMAGQVVADLRHTRAMVRLPTDARTWAPLGPGSNRGMQRLLGIPLKGWLGQARFDVLLPQVISAVEYKLPDIYNDRHLEAMDIQNCLCEFDKYVRTVNGEGRPRTRYPGAGAEQLKLI